MKLDVSYELLDYRDTPRPLTGVGLILTHPGVLEIIGTDAQMFSWDIPDEDANFEDDEANKTVVLHTPEGRIVLVELGLASFQKTIRQHYGDGFPRFTTDAQINQYFYHGILRGDL